MSTQEATVSAIVQRLTGASGLVRSIVLLGSHHTADATHASDVDILIVTHKPLDTHEAAALGALVQADAALGPGNAFSFHNPVCERCRLVPSNVCKMHFIVHTWTDLARWLEEREFIVCMWARCSTTLFGDDPFRDKPLPLINKSLLDEWDGVPGFLKQLRAILVTKNEFWDRYEYDRYFRFFIRRTSELRASFPELCEGLSPPSTTHGRQGLVDIGTFLEGLLERIRASVKQPATAHT